MSSASRSRFSQALRSRSAFWLTASAQTQGSAAKYGGTLVVGLSAGDPDTLDPTLSRSASADRDLPGDLPAALRLRRQACSSSRCSPRRCRCSRRTSSATRSSCGKGIQFNDGTPFNAQAVVTTVQRYHDLPRLVRASDYAPVDSVTASGPYTVVFHLNARDSTFIGGNPYVLSPTQLAKLGANFATNPVCVGPFMFDHRVAGDNVTVIKSPYYYDQKDVYLDKIVFKPMPDAAGRGGGAEGGRHPGARPGLADRAAGRPADLEPAGARRRPSSAGGASSSTSATRTAPATCRTRTSARRSRRARSCGRRSRRRSTATRSTRSSSAASYQPSCTPIPPANTAWYDATKVPCTPYDPERREEARRRVGLLEPDRAPADAEHDRPAPAGAVHPGAGGGGRDQRRDRLDRQRDGAGAQRRAGTSTPYLGGIVPGEPDPNGIIYRFLATSGSRNYSGYSNPRLDLILANGAEGDEHQGTVDALPRRAADHRAPTGRSSSSTTRLAFVAFRHELDRRATDPQRQAARRKRASTSDRQRQVEAAVVSADPRRRRCPSARRARAPSRRRRRPPPLRRPLAEPRRAPTRGGLACSERRSLGKLDGALRERDRLGVRSPSWAASRASTARRSTKSPRSRRRRARVSSRRRRDTQAASSQRPSSQ